jgi:hypothetical protein
MTGCIPAWAGSKTKATVNGKAVDATLTPGTWANIDRTWKDSDRVELSLACVSASPPSTTATRSSSLSSTAPSPSSPSNLSPHHHPQATPRRPAHRQLISMAGRNRRRKVRMLPYPDIKDETYRLYHQT